MSECAGLSGVESEFLLTMRKIEEMWRQGFIGEMTLRFGPQRDIVFKYTTTWRAADERRKG